MNVLVRAVMGQIADLAKEKGFEHARVDWKVNTRGELVIALLIPPRIAGEWSLSPVNDRESKRRAREQRS